MYGKVRSATEFGSNVMPSPAFLFSVVTGIDNVVIFCSIVVEAPAVVGETAM